MKAGPPSAGGSGTLAGLGVFLSPGLHRLMLRCLRSAGDDGNVQPVSQEESGCVQRAFSRLAHYVVVRVEQCRLSVA